MKKLLVIGDKEVGKDTFIDILGEVNPAYKHTPGSMLAIQDMDIELREKIFGITDPDECWAIRDNYRVELCQYFESMMGIMPEYFVDLNLDQQNVYTGMRTQLEYNRTKHRFDAVAYVTRNGFTHVDTTFNIKYIYDMHQIRNDGDLVSLRGVAKWFNRRHLVKPNPSNYEVKYEV